MLLTCYMSVFYKLKLYSILWLFSNEDENLRDLEWICELNFQNRKSLMTNVFSKTSTLSAVVQIYENVWDCFSVETTGSLQCITQRLTSIALLQANICSSFPRLMNFQAKTQTSNKELVRSQGDTTFSWLRLFLIYCKTNKNDSANSTRISFFIPF